MSIDRTPYESPASGADTAGEVVAGPWPSYSEFSNLPERDRWVIYGQAKALRYSREQSGIRMDEPYDSFITRICLELNL